MRLNHFLIPLVLALIFSCNTENRKPAENIVIRIQPFSDMDSGEVSMVAKKINSIYPKLIINPPVELPQFAFYEARARYKADSLLKFLSSMAKPNEILLGLTVKDISTQRGKINDWGVMGLGKCPGNSCVASNFRLNKTKGKNQLFKVAIHELGHTLGLPHCPISYCYMRDAEGGNPTDEEIDFCPACKKFLRPHHWQLN